MDIYSTMYPFVSRNIRDRSSVLEIEHYARHRNFESSFFHDSFATTDTTSSRICADLCGETVE